MTEDANASPENLFQAIRIPKNAKLNVLGVTEFELCAPLTKGSYSICGYGCESDEDEVSKRIQKFRVHDFMAVLVNVEGKQESRPGR